MPVKINGASSGSVTLAAPASGSDVTLTLPAAAGTAATTAYADSAGGLQLVASQSFSAVSAVSVNNCFTSTYDNYRVMVNLIASTSISVELRLRASGSDASGANTYKYQQLESYATTTASVARSLTSMSIGYSNTTQRNSSSVDLFGPALAQSTGLLAVGGRMDDLTNNAGEHTTASAYDGFTVFPNTGNVTGTLRVYGYKNS